MMHASDYNEKHWIDLKPTVHLDLVLNDFFGHRRTYYIT